MKKLISINNEIGKEIAAQGFYNYFKEKCDFVAAAPGRVNIIGEHIDYCGGLVLPIAIEHKAFLAFKKTDSNIINIASSFGKGFGPTSLGDEPEFWESTIDNIENTTGWGKYLAGVLQVFGKETGFNAYLHSCVPVGAGLSSSAAIECATAIALEFVDFVNKKENKNYNYKTLKSEFSINDSRRSELALKCVNTENNVIGVPTGVMDQSASMRCKKNNAMLLDCSTLKAEQIPFNIASNDLELLIVDSAKKHKVIDGGYASRKKTCDDSAKKLGVNKLVEISSCNIDTVLDKLGSDTLAKKRVKHVLTEINRVKDFVKALKEQDFIMAGKLMTESHYSLSYDYEVSTPELDLIVETALKCGALGARMTGAGFGGCAIVLTNKDLVSEICNKIDTSYSFDQKRPKFASVVPENGAEIL